jgi:hypothetical protein
MFIIISAVVKLLLDTAITSIDKYTLVASCSEKRVGGPSQCIGWSDMLANFALVAKKQNTMF